MFAAVLHHPGPADVLIRVRACRVSYHDIVDAETMEARLKVAVQARCDPDLMLIARTDVLREGGTLEDAVARGRRYVAAGADALMVLDLAPADFANVRAALPGTPLVWIGGVVPPIPSTVQLAEAGVALALYPFNTIAAIADAVGRLWSNAAETGCIAQSDSLLVPMRRQLAEIAGLELYWNLEDDLARRSRRGGERTER